MPEARGQELDAKPVTGTSPATGTSAAVASPARRPAARAVKHGLDRGMAACGLVVTAPLFAALALALGRSGPEGVLRREECLGEGGRTIVVLSFAITERMARSGAWRVVAASGLSALPQLWNVLRGDLSLVGPRPRARGLPAPPARPGLTGLAQLRQVSAPISTSDRLELDEQYARSWTLRLDARIAGRTLWRVLH